ncbi:hypothetical protein AVEN_241500-1 [Araneus ventricosus]|uniref:Uncharacterized protein n=1 Tax=Araneus ventricosus TaxID=182803 RepID=A0A4Y2FLU5_ARAVE|nr:hypothetical protein AVEN_241500-1 [Araneus ventricosus]
MQLKLYSRGTSWSPKAAGIQYIDKRNLSCYRSDILERNNYYRSHSLVGKLSGILVRLEITETGIMPKISSKQLHWSRECIQFATGPATSRDSFSILQTTADVEK